MVATITQTIFTNYLNMVAETKIDYPEEIAMSTNPAKHPEGE